MLKQLHGWWSTLGALTLGRLHQSFALLRLHGKRYQAHPQQALPGGLSKHLWAGHCLLQHLQSLLWLSATSQSHALVVEGWRGVLTGRHFTAMRFHRRCMHYFALDAIRGDMHGMLVSRVISRAQMLGGAAAAAGLAVMLLASCLPAAVAAVSGDPERRQSCRGGQALWPPAAAQSGREHVD